MEQLQNLARECENRYLALETRHPLASITGSIESLPAGFLENAIKQYQEIIRGNPWYFSLIPDIDVGAFLTRWNAVHSLYFSLAEEIFLRLAQNGGQQSALVDAKLLERTIRSETMRGWVGKRSPSGLDALLEKRVTELETLLQTHFNPDALDELLAIGGVYDSPEFMSAERQMIQLYEAHERTGGELAIEAFAQLHETEPARVLLRGFCRYSVSEFNKKLRALLANRPHGDALIQDGKNQQGVMSELLKIPEQERGIATRLFEEVRILNYLNLNLEVRYSFKGWAGLMHMVVFAACSDATNIPFNVYAMHTELNK